MVNVTIYSSTMDPSWDYTLMMLSLDLSGKETSSFDDITV